jgi:hypothetical protein
MVHGEEHFAQFIYIIILIHTSELGMDIYIPYHYIVIHIIPR